MASGQGYEGALAFIEKRMPEFKNKQTNFVL